jgi:hypothetical protein
LSEPGMDFSMTDVFFSCEKRRAKLITSRNSRQNFFRLTETLTTRATLRE